MLRASGRWGLDDIVKDGDAIFNKLHHLQVAKVTVRVNAALEPALVKIMFSAAAEKHGKRAVQSITRKETYMKKSSKSTDKRSLSSSIWFTQCLA